jgi:hypothetical protein
MVPDAKANPNKCRGPHVSKGEVVRKKAVRCGPPFHLFHYFKRKQLRGRLFSGCVRHNEL